MATLRKTAKLEAPYAVFKNEFAGWEWRVLKVNQPKRSPYDPEGYATWFVAAKSPMTYGSWEYGDTYAAEILRFGNIADATPEFQAYIKGFKS